MKTKDTQGDGKASKMLEADLVAGVVLGDRYELLTPVAKGGMGRVWVARAKGGRGFKRFLAVKTLLSVDYEEARLEEMLLQEAKLAALIHHPNVVAVEDFGEHRGVCYIAMELVRGETLLGLIKAAQPSGGIPTKLVVNLLGQVCRGLHAAHELVDENDVPLGLIHRDVTPGNIIVTYDGIAKLLDFGIAKASTSAALTQVGEIKGKMSYMAPEMLMQAPIDRRVDIFAIGIMLYLATTGVHPFRGSKGESDEILARIVSDKPPMAPSDLTDFYPVELEKVVMKALAKDRDQRYSSAEELLEALTAAVPEAFSPNIERETQAYLEDLLSERISETNAQLRAAEELAEKSFPDVSKVQVVPVVSKPPDPMKEIVGLLIKIVVSFVVLMAVIVIWGLKAGWLYPPPHEDADKEEAVAEVKPTAPQVSAVPAAVPAPSASATIAPTPSASVAPKPVKRAVRPDSDLWITPKTKPKPTPSLSTTMPASGLPPLDPWAPEPAGHATKRRPDPIRKDL